MGLKINYSSMLESVIGPAGIKDFEIKDNLFRLQDIYREMQTDKMEGGLGFAKLPYQKDQLEEIIWLARVVREEFESVIVIGVGGSDLGTRAVQRALNHQFYNQIKNLRQGGPRLYFVGDTTDPVDLEEVIDVVDLKTTLVVMVSKSGNTVEQMSSFLSLRQRLVDLLGYEDHKKHIVTVTDPEGGNLRELTNREGYRSLPVPQDVGGRFSVLSSVGLFPLAVVGIDIKALLQGAQDMDKHDCETEDVTKNIPAYYTYLMYLSYTLRRQSIRVLMPYVYSLRDFGFWYRQLWAESLGKAATLDGNAVEVGPTPIAALGPTDQHSQLQLYMEGPINKAIIFITADTASVKTENGVKDLSGLEVPKAFEDMEGVGYLGGHTFNEILQAEQKSTQYALTKAGRPSCHISIPCLDAYNLGQLIYFFELAVTYAGKFHHVNPFDQPAVEIGKRYMYGLLGREGYEEYVIESDGQENWLG